MQRITITIDDDLLARVDRLCEQRGYGSRSEAIRDIVRDAAAPVAADGASPACYGALSYVYSHGTRDLARRLTGEGHHHGVSIASLHVHLGRDDCLEVAVLRGSVSAMQGFADTVTTQRGVRYGHLHLIPEGAGQDEAGHGDPPPAPGAARG
ncbi:nickel-responsive transcriptional regulator NikR [uncultured Methylobacterium sp.]|uniref:nickel-responsive transcriptional regulator NikR n=1 Tax=uncultured Methylobacterium sp. TaxID=157278 RepID=UPI0035CAB452